MKGVVDDSCGLFVSSSKGAPGNPGTKDKPLASFAEALAKDPKAIFACGEMFTEAVTVAAAVDLQGALDCSKLDWAYDATKKTALTAASDAVPLTLANSANGARVTDFAITAADAAMPGGSSIAVIADQVMADLVRVDVTAQKGANGAAGTTPNMVGPNGEGMKGAPGVAGGDGCLSSSSIVGGDGGSSTCTGTDVSGGIGGNGTKTGAGGPGADAQPQPQPGAIAPNDGLGGKAQTGSACAAGHFGASGTEGSAGTGATGIGSINSTGYSAPVATDGASPGTPGYGGGGGGGAFACLNAKAGASGGGGGAGGCGGAVGKAGGAGGSSIAILSNNAKLKLTDVTLTSGKAGDGGVGGDGQKGGGGGSGGPAGMSNDAASTACGGGNGGQGGRGGSGGGGLGGHSLGIAFNGTAPEQTNVTVTPGSAGNGGIGGDMTVSASGANGLACKTLDFADAKSCM